MLSAFFSADVCFAFGSQLPLVPDFLPATALKPGQQVWPPPADFFAGLFFAGNFFAGVFFAAVFFVVAMER